MTTNYQDAKWERDTLFLACTISKETKWSELLKYPDFLWALHLTNDKESLEYIIKKSKQGGSLKHRKIQTIQDSDGYGGDPTSNQFFTRYSANKPIITPYDEYRHKYAILFKIPLAKGDVPPYVTIRNHQFGNLQGDVIFDLKNEDIRNRLKTLIVSPKQRKNNTITALDDNEIAEKLPGSLANDLLTGFPESKRPMFARRLFFETSRFVGDAVFNGIPPQNMIEGVFENTQTFQDPKYKDISDNYGLFLPDAESDSDSDEEYLNFYVNINGYTLS